MSYLIKRAQDQLSPMLSRKLGCKVGVIEDIDRLNSDIKSGLLIEKIEWLLTGSYGCEYRELLINDYKTSARKKQAIKRIVINAAIYTCLIDYEDLNSRKITQVIKNSGKMDNINECLIDYMINGYGSEHWDIDNL